MELAGQGRQMLAHCSAGESLMGAAPAWVSLLIISLGAAGKPVYHITASSGSRAAIAQAVPRRLAPVPDTTAEGNLTTVAGNLSQAKSLPRNPSLPVAADNPFTERKEGEPAAQGGAAAAVGASRAPLQPSTSAASADLQQGADTKAAPGSQKQAHELDARKQARKAQDAARVAPGYELDELTDEWQSTLQTIDDHLYQAGRPSLDGRERSVVMRCLIESTARESTDTAVHRAVGTIERLRRMHAHSPSMQPRV
ncbi:hypothetical protein WJX73_009639 [Symbiochloris irregularis]|uniref:Uncharacterized protein n=1 Tax=Symbiochloris irregularis TaxID=706552 RepID=A0AAW1PKG4_9CHLO